MVDMDMVDTYMLDIDMVDMGTVQTSDSSICTVYFV